MKIIAIKTLRDFWTANPDAEQPLKAWVDEASKAEWKTPAEIKEQYRSASILKNRRVVFNIKGNDYRLIVAIAYQRGWMFIKFIGTHKEYDKIDAEINEKKNEKSSRYRSNSSNGWFFTGRCSYSTGSR